MTAKAAKNSVARKPHHMVKAWRKHRRLTLERLAEMTPYTPGAISQLETGRTNYTQPMIEALAEALECSPGDLLSRDPSSPEPRIDSDAEILAFLNRIDGLTETDIGVAHLVIANARSVNRAGSKQSVPDDQSRTGSPRHAETPSR